MIYQSDSINELDNQRIERIIPLIPPQILMSDIPITPEASNTCSIARTITQNIVNGSDDRLLVVVGPCSIHDIVAANEYALLLNEYSKNASNDLHIIMRVYFEKPRTTIGWKGLINDPYLNGSFSINSGLKLARKLLLDINQMGLPAGCEFLDTISPQYIADLVSWGAIGARTTESQVHRELASGLSASIGFKNGTDGNISIAVDAIKCASSGHHFLSVSKQGLSAIVETKGNKSCHLILRGGKDGPNYESMFIKDAVAQLEKSGVCARLMIDCSHGNSQKKHLLQIEVAKNICKQLMSNDSESTANNIMGVMIESHLVAGNQSLTDDLSKLDYGKSITDACINWDDTVKVLDGLRLAVQTRRKNNILNSKV